jgi:hypothetical protein
MECRPAVVLPKGGHVPFWSGMGAGGYTSVFLCIGFAPGRRSRICPNDSWAHLCATRAHRHQRRILRSWSGTCGSRLELNAHRDIRSPLTTFGRTRKSQRTWMSANAFHCKVVSYIAVAAGDMAASANLSSKMLVRTVQEQEAWGGARGMAYACRGSGA